MKNASNKVPSQVNYFSPGVLYVNKKIKEILQKKKKKKRQKEKSQLEHNLNLIHLITNIINK